MEATNPEKQRSLGVDCRQFYNFRTWCSLRCGKEPERDAPTRSVLTAVPAERSEVVGELIVSGELDEVSRLTIRTHHQMTQDALWRLWRP